MRHATRRLRVLLPCIAILSGCTVFGAVDVPPVTTYTLSETPLIQPLTGSAVGILSVSPVVATYGFESNEMIYQPASYQFAAFSENAWFAPPAVMISPLIMKTLRQTHHFAGVVSSSSGASAYLLNTHLIALYQDFTVNPSQVVLILNLTLIDEKTGKILLSDQEISERVPSQKNTPYGGVVAANQALDQALIKMVKFILIATQNRS